jgi:hypothetical protein
MDYEDIKYVKTDRIWLIRTFADEGKEGLLLDVLLLLSLSNSALEEKLYC